MGTRAKNQIQALREHLSRSSKDMDQAGYFNTCTVNVARDGKPAVMIAWSYNCYYWLCTLMLMSSASDFIPALVIIIPYCNPPISNTVRRHSVGPCIQCSLVRVLSEILIPNTPVQTGICSIVTTALDLFGFWHRVFEQA